MSEVEQLAVFAHDASYERLSRKAREQLKVRILDALGCALGALGAEPVRMVRDLTTELGGKERCAMIGGGATAPDRAALLNGFLVRYLDFNDSYLAAGETCHPSDSLAAVLAACQYAGGPGRDLLASLAVAYQVQCRLSDEAPVRARGFDHTVQGAYAVAAGAARALGLDAGKTANAIAISGTAFNALRVTRTGALSHWKGLAAPHMAAGALHAALMAMHGISGPREVFEGNKGLKGSIAGPFTIDWGQEDLERATRTIVKRYNAEVHSQATLEGILELGSTGAFASGIESIDIETFDVAYNIIGGGEEGEKTTVRTKEEADHSLPYMVAAAALDGQVMPEQYEPGRIQRQDIQSLLRKVRIRPAPDLSRRFPEEMPCRISVGLKGGRTLTVEKKDYEGFHTRPMSWETTRRKFDALSARGADASLRDEIADAVRRLEEIPVADLCELLSRAGR
jgi:2-methylcitrate dehydratase